MIYVCCGLPRSGSTLQFNILRMIVAGQGWEVLDWVKGSDLPSVIMKHRSNSDNTLVFKSHKCPEFLFEAGYEVTLLTTYRDFRDIAASNKVAFDNSVDKTIKDLAGALESLSVAKYRNIPTYIGNYDQFRDDIVTEAMNIGSFLGIDVSRQRAIEVGKACSLEKAFEASVSKKVGKLQSMKRRLLLFLGVAPYKDKGLRLHHNHVSSRLGASNYYEEVLTLDETAKVEVGLSKYWNSEKTSVVLQNV